MLFAWRSKFTSIRMLLSFFFFKNWTALFDAKWISKFKERKHQTKNGHFDVRSSRKLRWWCLKQKDFLIKNKLPKETRDILKRIGFINQNESAVAAQPKQASAINLTFSARKESVTLQPRRRMCLIYRTIFLEQAFGITIPKTNYNIWSKVTHLEMELYGNTKKRLLRSGSTHYEEKQSERKTHSFYLLIVLLSSFWLILARFCVVSNVLTCAAMKCFYRFSILFFNHLTLAKKTEISDENLT